MLERIHGVVQDAEVQDDVEPSELVERVAEDVDGVEAKSRLQVAPDVLEAIPVYDVDSGHLGSELLAPEAHVSIRAADVEHALAREHLARQTQSREFRLEELRRFDSLRHLAVSEVDGVPPGDVSVTEHASPCFSGR